MMDRLRHRREELIHHEKRKPEAERERGDVKFRMELPYKEAGGGGGRRTDKTEECGSERAVGIAAGHHRPEIGSRLPAGSPGKLGLEMSSAFRHCTRH